MANHIQRVEYEGYIGADPEMRYTPSGKAVSNFSIGSTSSYTNAAGEKVSNTTWLRISAWGKLAEIVNEYCKKGSHVIVFGRLKGDEKGRPAIFEGTNGATASFDVVASEVHIMDKMSKTESTPAEGAGEEDEFPF